MMLRHLSILQASSCLIPKLAVASAKPIALAAYSFTTTSPALAGRALPPRPKPPPESEIEESFLKGSGPGGQKINKTNSAVQLKHLPTGIVVKSQATRSRDQNRKIAREVLAQRIDDQLNGDQSRTAQVAQIKNKRSASADKKKRRKYKKLNEENQERTDETEPSDLGSEEASPEVKETPSSGTSVDGSNKTV